MKVAIHQPQYLPWLPYFLKIAHSDLFVFLDSVAFQKNGLQNRNRIKTAQGPRWLTVPVRQRLGQRIDETMIDNMVDWRRKHWETLRQSYARAASFRLIADELAALYGRSWERLGELDVEMCLAMMRWMGIGTPCVRSSSLQAQGSASELVLSICTEVGATRYLCGPGGLHYLDRAAFESAGVAIQLEEHRLPGEYPQQFPNAGFANDLSALDLVMNAGETWRDYLPPT
jgi:hypothetical protein